MKHFKKIAALSLLAVPIIAFAQAQPGPATGATGVPSSPLNTVSSALNLLCYVFGWMFYALMALSVIFIVVAAYGFLTSSGNPEKVKGARNTLLYAAIAVAVALLAKGIPLIAANFIGANGNIGACSAGSSSSGGGGINV